MFRAIIWQITGREETGVRIAAWIGRAAAVGVVAFALLNRGRRNRLAVNIAIALLVAWFLWQGAGDALRNAEPFVAHQHAGGPLHRRHPATAPEGAPTTVGRTAGSDLLRAMAARPADVYALTEADGSVVGSLSARAVDDAYRASR